MSCGFVRLFDDFARFFGALGFLVVWVFLRVFGGLIRVFCGFVMFWWFYDSFWWFFFMIFMGVEWFDQCFMESSYQFRGLLVGLQVLWYC